MRKIMSGLLVLAAAAALTTGCQNDCDEAADRLTAKFESCGITVSTGEDGSDVECTEALGNQAQCVADCTDAASCDALTGDDLDGALDYVDCLGGC